MEFGSHLSPSRRWCSPTEDYSERPNHYTKITEEKLIPDWFYSPYCDVCKNYREFTNNVCSCHFTLKVPLSCDYCGNVYIEYFYKYLCNPTCSHECYLK